MSEQGPSEGILLDLLKLIREEIKDIREKYHNLESSKLGSEEFHKILQGVREDLITLSQNIKELEKQTAVSSAIEVLKDSTEAKDYQNLKKNIEKTEDKLKDIDNFVTSLKAKLALLPAVSTAIMYIVLHVINMFI